MEFTVQETGTKLTVKLKCKYVSDFVDVTQDTLNEVHNLYVYDGDTITIALASYIVNELEEYVNPAHYEDCLCDLDNWKLTIKGFDYKWYGAWRKAMGKAFA